MTIVDELQTGGAMLEPPHRISGVIPSPLAREVDKTPLVEGPYRGLQPLSFSKKGYSLSAGGYGQGVRREKATRRLGSIAY
jgi:hypothetical protein